MRHEKISQSDQLWIDSRGVQRNRLLTRHLNLLRLEILDSGYFVGNQQWNQFDVVSPFGRLYFMIADHGWLETDQGRIDLLPGFMYLIPPYARVNLRTEARIEKFYFHFSIRYAGIEVLEGINRCFSLPLPDDLLQEILAAFRGSELADLLKFQGLASSTLASFIRDGLPDLGRRMDLAETYKDVFAYIEQHLSASLSGRQICAALGCTYETMRRNFSRDNGITFNRYVNGRLVQEAAMQLLLTSRTIQEIAGTLGFTDEFYFSRLFKQKMEYSPREYRRINAVLRNG